MTDNIRFRQILLKNKLSVSSLNREEQKVKSESKSMETTDLKDVKGFWQGTITKLFDNWIYSTQDLKDKWEEFAMGLFMNPLSRNHIKNFFNK